MLERVRHTTSHWQAGVSAYGWPARLGVSVGLAGFLGVMATISFPLPWTPVPFSMAPLALLVVGAYQRPAWATLSVLLYLVAGALGAPIYAEGSSGWQHLMGATAGYLLGYIALAMFASWYIQQRRRLLPAGWVAAVGALIAVLVIGGVAAIVRFTGAGGGFDAYGESFQGWSHDTSLLWVFAFLGLAAAAVVTWSLLRARGQGLQALNLYLVFLAGTGILHVMGVTGLVTIGGLDVMTAIIVGSVVFLPFDIIKAGLAVAATLPFLPESHA